MALVGVSQPGLNPKKEESTFDKVLKGLQVAGQLINVGTGVYEAAIKSKQAGTDAKIADLRDKEFTVNVAKTLKPVSEQEYQADPQNKFKLDIPGVGPYFELRPDPKDVSTYINLAEKGWGRIVNEPAAVSAQQSGQKPTKLDNNIYFLTDPAGAELDLSKRRADLAKAWADINKVTKETEGLGKDSTEKVNKAADDLRKEFESKPEVRGARDIIAIADRADELVKRNTVSDQVAMAYGFIRSQGPGVVSQQELDLAARGAFTDELLNKFGWTRLKDGRFMTEDQMKGVADTLKSTANTYIKSLEPQVATYSRLAKDRGLNVDDVIIPLRVRQQQLFQELNPQYLLKKDPKEMTPFEKELFQKNYGGGDGGSR